MLFGLFKRKSTKERMLEKHRKLLEVSYKLSAADKRLADEKALEAQALMRMIEKM